MNRSDWVSLDCLSTLKFKVQLIWVLADKKKGCLKVIAKLQA